MPTGPSKYLIFAQDNPDVVGFLILNDGIHIVPGEKLSLCFHNNDLDRVILRPMPTNAIDWDTAKPSHDFSISSVLDIKNLFSRLFRRKIDDKANL